MGYVAEGEGEGRESEIMEAKEGEGWARVTNVV